MDLAGAGLAAVALGGLAFVLVQGPAAGWTSVPVLIAGVAGVVSVIAFVFQERRTAQPTLPLELFAARNFSAGNATTVAIYAVFNGNFFILSIYLLTDGAGLQPAAGGARDVAGDAAHDRPVIADRPRQPARRLASTHDRRSDGGRPRVRVGDVANDVLSDLQDASVTGYRTAMVVGAVLAAMGGAVSFLGVRNAASSATDTGPSSEA